MRHNTKNEIFREKKFKTSKNDKNMKKIKI